MKWEIRKRDLLKKNGMIHVDIARENDKIIGYCVSTINAEMAGEIDSIYIEKERRRFGIGSVLMKNALKWMDTHKVKRRVISVAAGNEEVFSFYERYGFYPRATILMPTDSK
jgi:ribosomal protein S18 acetylase RimI-like enzyme